MPRKMPGYAGKMREKSKAIPSRFPFENILCRFSIALDTPTPTWHSGTFIVLVVLIFLFVCCCFPFSGFVFRLLATFAFAFDNCRMQPNGQGK